MSELNRAVGDATRTEAIGEKLAGSAAFTASLGSPNGHQSHGGAQQQQQQATGEPHSAEQQTGEPTATPAATGTQEPEQRHIVPGIGNHPAVKPPQADPYSQLAGLLRANC